jgi:ABC-2 type transport system permease protein
MRALLSLMLRTTREEWRLIFQERAVLLVLVGVPVLYPMVVAWLYGAQQAVERPAIVVDADNSELSRRLTLELDATQDLAVVARTDSLEDGRVALVRGDAELLVFVPADFSRLVKQGKQASIKVWVDAANMYTYSLSFPAVHAVVGSLNAELAIEALERRGVPSASAPARATPITRDERFLFHPTGSYARFFVVGILLIVLQQLVVLAVAYSAGYRRERGLFDHDAHPVAYLTGMLGAHVPFHLAGIAVAVLGVMPAFHWSPPSSVAVAVLMLLFMASLLPTGLILSSLVEDRIAAFQLVMFFSAPLFIASGFTWPTTQMPLYLRAVTALFPATPALQALRVLSMKSGSLLDVAHELGWLAAQLAAYSALALYLVPRAAWLQGRATPTVESQGVLTP